MKIILEANESVLTILSTLLKKGSSVRWSQYCVHNPVEDGVLVFNMLTREFIFLTQEEYARFADLDYLKEHWFVVPEGTKEKENADFLKWVLSTRQPKPKAITGYTIFPTTDCNARCFYCFELGGSRIPMTIETAEKVVQYIKNHCGGKAVSIKWFGGEPLFNIEAIDTIVDGLRREKIEFKSRMVSNGYLFNDEIVRRAAEQWNLKSIQITLDGTEKVYNKIKAYIHKDTNPYAIVMENIRRLVDAGIYVSIRLNMDLYNADDLLVLAEELAQRFGGKKGITVYAHHLFKAGTSNAELHSEEEWEKREAAMRRLDERLESSGLLSVGGISRNIKLNHCMADNGRSVTILPNGDLGLCEHHAEDEFIGHIDRDGFDSKVVARWKERTPEIPECAECFYYLDCVKLKKCSSSSVCYQMFRDEKLQKAQRAMLATYQKWQENALPDTEDNDDDFEE